MSKKQYVSFVDNKILTDAVSKVVDAWYHATTENDVDKNILDPFSMLFESALQDWAPEDWLKAERTRQVQKTLQNAVGVFHQAVIGGIKGWENLGNGNLVDVRNKSKKIIAEVKNKYNTVTGIHLIKIYDELQDALNKPEHVGYQGYFVMMITKHKNHQRMFTPSDRTARMRRPENSAILEISGFKFYEIATGVKGALFELFNSLPVVLEEARGIRIDKFKSERVLKGIFERTYRD